MIGLIASTVGVIVVLIAVCVIVSVVVARRDRASGPVTGPARDALDAETSTIGAMFGDPGYDDHQPRDDDE